ncbi:MAG: 2-oxo acid dehydrogenase subunit E2, partial [Actinomycetota bacterium]
DTVTATSGPAPNGPNTWLIDELFEQYQGDRRSVPVEWQQLFDQRAQAAAGAPETTPAPADPPAPAAAPPVAATPPPAGTTPFPTAEAAGAPASNGATGPAAPSPAAPASSTAAPTPTNGAAPAPTTPTTTPPAPVAASAPAPTTPAPAPAAPTTPAAPAVPAAAAEAAPEPPGEAIRGVAARIVTNMEASLDVPTATSFREIPAKLLEVNRRVLNNHMRRVRGRKVSFTHIIGYAVVRAITDAVPNMNNTFVTDDDGKPRLVRNEHVNLGIAVDQQKADGSRSLVVPVIKHTETMNFEEFVDAYEERIDKVRANKLSVDDLTGATISLTNPGTIGTIQSVPRLMPGQGAIIGVGAIGYPAEYQAADPHLIAQLGLSKIIAITSTYDHRIIQGAESGLFLKKIHELLLGEDGFYDKAFEDVGVPYEAVQWRIDRGTAEDEHSVDGRVAKQMAVGTLINQYRVRGHLIANTNPLAENTTKRHPELD